MFLHTPLYLPNRSIIEFCRKFYCSFNNFSMIEDMKRQLLELLVSIGFVSHSEFNSERDKQRYTPLLFFFFSYFFHFINYDAGHRTVACKYVPSSPPTIPIPLPSLSSTLFSPPAYIRKYFLIPPLPPLLLPLLRIPLPTYPPKLSSSYIQQGIWGELSCEGGEGGEGRVKVQGEEKGGRKRNEKEGKDERRN